MRDLTAHDVFMAARVLQKVGVKDEIVDFATQMMNGMNDPGNAVDLQSKLGAQLIFGVLGNFGDEGVEKAFFAFLSGPLEMKPEELSSMELFALVDLVDEWIKSVDRDRWQAFFTSLKGLLSKKT